MKESGDSDFVFNNYYQVVYTFDPRATAMKPWPLVWAIYGTVEVNVSNPSDVWKHLIDSTSYENLSLDVYLPIFLNWMQLPTSVDLPPFLLFHKWLGTEYGSGRGNKARTRQGVPVWMNLMTLNLGLSNLHLWCVCEVYRRDSPEHQYPYYVRIDPNESEKSYDMRLWSDELCWLAGLLLIR